MCGCVHFDNGWLSVVVCLVMLMVGWLGCTFVWVLAREAGYSTTCMSTSVPPSETEIRVTGMSVSIYHLSKV